MKVFKYSLLILLILIFNGCSSKGMITAGHNGKLYWNPGNCSQFRYYHNNPDTIYCLTNGQFNGTVLKPADQQQIANYQYQQQQEQQTWNNLNNQIQNSNTNRYMQNQNFQLQQLNQNLNRLNNQNFYNNINRNNFLFK